MPIALKQATERKLLKRLKEICHEIGLSALVDANSTACLHHFASLCTNHQIAYRKALYWLGHSSSQILDLYYHLYDNNSQAAMKALTTSTFHEPVARALSGEPK